MKSTCRQADDSLYPDFHLSVYCHCVQFFGHTSQSFFFFFMHLMACTSASTATYGLKIKVDTSFTQCQGNLNLLDCNRQCRWTERLVIQSRHKHTHTFFCVSLVGHQDKNTMWTWTWIHTYIYPTEIYRIDLWMFHTLRRHEQDTHSYIDSKNNK